MYHNIFTVDDCEVKCTEETRFRCMLSVYRQGTCHLWSKLPISEASNAKHLLFLSGAYSSSLQGKYNILRYKGSVFRTLFDIENEELQNHIYINLVFRYI